ncbi:MAG: hypothetical protein AAGU11_17555 [Syntrophobacteraceae bacterium]
MNHRELVLSAEKKARFEFLRLPEEIQDAVIDGLDGQSLTLKKASALLKSKGFSLSHEAIASYYRAVRRERRLAEVRQVFKNLLEEFGEQPYEEGLKTLNNIAIATAISGIADGSVGIKAINLAQLVKAMNSKPGTVLQAKEGGESPKAEGNIPDAETIRQIRERYL